MIGDDRPAGPEIGCGLDHSRAAEFVHEQLADVLAAVVDDARVRHHRVPATAGLPVAVHRQREAVGGLYDPAFIRWAADALPRRTADVDAVNHAAHDVEVVAHGGGAVGGGVRLV